MVRAGLLSDDQLAAVQARSAERKLSFVEALLELGTVDEDSVVNFLHSKLMIPRVGASVLDTVDRNALLRIPAELAQRHAVLPISADETGNLTVAMVDPTDMRAVDAISAHTGAYLVRAVAPLRIIRGAIARHYSLPAPSPVAAPVAAPITGPLPARPVSAPVIAVPTVSVPTISAPLIPTPVVPAVAPIAAPSIAVPATPVAASERPTSGTFVAAAPTQPASPVPTTTIKPAAVVPAATIKPSAVIRPSAVFQPSAVLQPSAVIMTGPRPAVVLPASAQTSHNYAPAQPLHPAFVPIPTQPPTQQSTPEPAPAAVAPTSLAHDFQPGGTATFEPAPSRRSPTAEPRPVNDDDETSASAERTLIAGFRTEIVDIPLDDFDEPPAPAPTQVAAQAAPPQDIDAHLPTTTWTPPQFGVANEIIPLSPEAFHRLLPRFALVTTRDEVTDLLLDFLAEGFSRVIMFTHIKGEIRGRDARGEDLMVEAVRQIRIPATGPSMFSGVIERRQPYFGAMRTDTAIDSAFFGALGGVDGMVLCLPVIMRDKVPLLVFASGSHNPVDPRSLQELTTEVSAALERLIVLDKARHK